MTDFGFWFVIAATGALFVLWLAANLFFVAVESAGQMVPLTPRPDWRARIDAIMLLLPAVAGVGAALLIH